VRARVAAAARGARFFGVERGRAVTHAAVAYARAVGAPTDADALAAAARLVPASSAAAEALCARLAAPILAAHPGAGGRAKRWDIAGFVQVAHWWRSRGGSVVAIAGPAEAGEPPALGAPEVRDWPLVDLAALLARAALYLGNDSGVSHLAGAVGAAGVVLFGPTEGGAGGRCRAPGRARRPRRRPRWYPARRPASGAGDRRVRAPVHLDKGGPRH